MIFRNFDSAEKFIKKHYPGHTLCKPLWDAPQRGWFRMLTFETKKWEREKEFVFKFEHFGKKRFARLVRILNSTNHTKGDK
jgi:hypothetical protein